MGLNERISSIRRRLVEGAGKHRRKRSKTSAKRPRTAAGDARKLSAAITGVIARLAKVVRALALIATRLWLAIAEPAGAAVLWVWRRLARPLLRALLATVRALYAIALRQATPARAVAFVALAALAVLAISQWVDYRAVTVGTPGYAGGLETFVPAPELARERAGEAHSWLLVPLAAAGALLLAFAILGRPRLAWLLAVVGGAAIAISIFVDAPKGLDEGQAAIAYEGVEAHLLEGFWLQIAAGAVLIASGLLLPGYLRGGGARAGASARPRADRPRRLLARTTSKRPPARTGRRGVDRKRGIEGAST